MSLESKNRRAGGITAMFSRIDAASCEWTCDDCCMLGRSIQIMKEGEEYKGTVSTLFSSDNIGTRISFLVCG